MKIVEKEFNAITGEETITESNLLEIQRRHPKTVHLKTFTKPYEGSTSGADWEWHLIGSKWTLKLRVQAKKVDENGKLKNIGHRVDDTKPLQIDLLINDAKKNDCYPIYCFYCAEEHRDIWTADRNNKWIMPETGCLLASAEDVKSLMPKDLSKIEDKTVPWHFLCFNEHLRTSNIALFKRIYSIRGFWPYHKNARRSIKRSDSDNDIESTWKLPTIADLNQNSKPHAPDGCIHGSVLGSLTSELPDSYFEKHRIKGIMMIDVRQEVGK